VSAASAAGHHRAPVLRIGWPACDGKHRCGQRQIIAETRRYG